MGNGREQRTRRVEENFGHGGKATACNSKSQQPDGAILSDEKLLRLRSLSSARRKLLEFLRTISEASFFEALRHHHFWETWSPCKSNEEGRQRHLGKTPAHQYAANLHLSKVPDLAPPGRQQQPEHRETPLWRAFDIPHGLLG